MNFPKLPRYREMMGEFLHSMQCDVVSVACGQFSFFVPPFDHEDVISLCRDAQTLFSNEPIVLALEVPVTIVGDLHGQILDLYRIIQEHGMPTRTQYLFLGDFVDRGEFSFEVVTFVFLAKVLYPLQVWVIRGNHEFAYICASGGFRAELDHLFHDDQVFVCFTEAFAQLPLAAVLDRSVVAVHGGIGPQFQSINQLREIKRPIYDFDEGVIDCVLWSDPSDELQMFEPSPRGAGYLFGPTAFVNFLATNQVRCMVRGHECVADGCAASFGGRLWTVFSASNYCGTSGNRAAVLVVGSGCMLETRTFAPLPMFARAVVVTPERPASLGSARKGAVTKKVVPKATAVKKPDGLPRPPSRSRPSARSMIDDTPAANSKRRKGSKP
jgi:protein phosphatase